MMNDGKKDYERKKYREKKSFLCGPVVSVVNIL